MRRFLIFAAAAALASGVMAAQPARADVVSDLLAALGLASAPAPSDPGTDFRNCDTGECE